MFNNTNDFRNNLKTNDFSKEIWRPYNFKEISEIFLK